MAAMGRPTDYTPELADKICEGIANAISLVKICSADDMPNPRTVYRWRREHEEFCQNYASAREDQADFFAEEIIDISDNHASSPLIIDGVPMVVKGEIVMRVDPAAVSHAKLMVDTRKWLASKFKPNNYADKLKQELSGPEGAPIQTDSVFEFMPVSSDG